MPEQGERQSPAILPSGQDSTFSGRRIAAGILMGLFLPGFSNAISMRRVPFLHREAPARNLWGSSRAVPLRHIAVRPFCILRALAGSVSLFL